MKYAAAQQATAIFLAALVIALPAFPLHAGESTLSLPSIGAGATNLQQNVDGGASIEDIRAEASFLGQTMPSAHMPVHYQAQPWRFVKQADLKPASISDIVSEARQVVSNDQDIPAPKLSQAASALAAMDGAQRIAMDDGRNLSSNEMGVYQFTPTSDWGHIFLSRLTPAISALAGLGLTASTVIHESYHRVEKEMGQLDGESIAAEVGAFSAQYQYLKALYPTGEEIATRRMQLANMLKHAPSANVAAALGFVSTMDALYGTGGVTNNIRNLVLKLGYSDGSHSSSSLPSS